MKKEAEQLINSYIKTLKVVIEDQETYEHIIASVLEIYTKQLPYSEVLNQIYKDVDGIKENQEVYWSVYSLAQAIASYNNKIRDMYIQEVIQDQDEWEDTITGEVYNFIDQNS